MTFQAKSRLAMLGIIAIVYGGYFGALFSAARHTPVEQILYQPYLLLATIPLVLLAIVAHGGIAIVAPREAGFVDERDRYNALRGERIGGLLLGIGVVVALGLVMFGGHSFWIAHTLLGGLVLAEIGAAAATLALYHWGR